MSKTISSRGSRGGGVPRALIWMLVALVVVLVIVALIYMFPRGVASVPLGKVTIGMAAPDFSLPAVREETTFTLSDLRGQVVLLSFINSQATASSLTADPSRSQIVFLKSMETQYGYKGMRVLIIDASPLVTGKRPSNDSMINFTYDWALDNIPVLRDDRYDTTARVYGVTSPPVTFLIDAEGNVTQRWDGFASAPQLAFALQDLVGLPVYDTPNPESPLPTPTLTPTPRAEAVTCDENPSEPHFGGMGNARQLSKNIWVVDGGYTWTSGRPFPLTWVIVGEENTEGPLHIYATAYDPRLEVGFVLADTDVEPVPDAEAGGILISEDNPNVHVYSISLPGVMGPGCLRIEAIVTQPGSSATLFSGQMDAWVQ